VKQAEVDGKRSDVPSDMAYRLKAPEPENRELRLTSEILRKRPLILPRGSSTASSAMSAFVDDHRQANGSRRSAKSAARPVDL
jgi:hypothetical protein